MNGGNETMYTCSYICKSNSRKTLELIKMVKEWQSKIILEIEFYVVLVPNKFLVKWRFWVLHLILEIKICRYEHVKHGAPSKIFMHTKANQLDDCKDKKCWQSLTSVIHTRIFSYRSHWSLKNYIPGPHQFNLF